jgi:hypothetical protein
VSLFLGVDQSPLLPPETGLNLNLVSYQSDEQVSQFGSQAFLGSFVQMKLTSLVHWEKGFLRSRLLVAPGKVGLLAGWRC